jgi:hypothetical protein
VSAGLLNYSALSRIMPKLSIIMRKLSRIMPKLSIIPKLTRKHLITYLNRP